MSKKMLVLVVEDEEYWQDRWKRELDGKVVLVSALSIEEAEEKFATNPDIDAIVMDARMPGGSPSTTLPLVRKLREIFTGPIIASSSLGSYRQRLVQAGCNHESEKESLPQKLLEVLGIT